MINLSKALFMISIIRRQYYVVRLKPTTLSYILFIVMIMCHLIVPRLSCAKFIYTEIIPPGWQSSEAYDINNNGTIVGSGRDETGKYRGFLYRSGTYKTLIPPGWEEAHARAVNDRGDVAGQGLARDYKGFLFSNGVYTEILPPGWKEAYAYGINNNGDIVGYGREMKYFKGFLYSRGMFTDILPPGWREAYAYGINGNGVITGYGIDENKKTRGFVYKNGAYTVILPPGLQESKAFHINELGAVAGSGLDIGNTPKSFTYKEGVYSEILAPGWQSVEAYGINNSGAVAGWGTYKGGHTIGFLYNGISFFSLIPPGWQWSQTYIINDRGDIIGYGSYGADNRGFMARGIPDISVDPMIIFFGGNIGSGRLPDRTVTIKNDGIGELIIGQVTAPQHPFSMTADNCSGKTLALYQTCTVSFGIKPVSGKTTVSGSEITSNDPLKKSVTLTIGVFPDNDGDGYTLDADCDDNDPLRNPGAAEVPRNGKDDDCNPSTADDPGSVR